MTDHNPTVRNLPVALSSFLGRDRELAEVEGLLAMGRLLTITGAGGSGKTRLAAVVAERVVQRYPDGAVWVELASVSDPELISQQVASTLGAGAETNGATPTTLAAYLKESRVLLVLDNCEHLVDEVAAFVDLLLRACRGVTVLATSREALGVTGERAWLVPALTLPLSGEQSLAAGIGQSTAVQLFVERARDGVPAFRLTDTNAPAVADICRRLDGIPLAIELAAARVTVLTPEQIAERLSDVFRLLTGGRRTAVPRQQTLRATMDWSYALLSEMEQKLLARLSVFVDGFTIEAAEAVTNDESLPMDGVLDGVSALVEKTMVNVREERGRARYSLLETVRQYGSERLAVGGQRADVGSRHMLYYLQFAETVSPRAAESPDDGWLRVLADEAGNLRAALRWALDRGDAEVAHRLAIALMTYWTSAGNLSEGSLWMREVLASGEANPDAKGRALFCAGTLAAMRMDPAVAEPHFEEALVIFRSDGNEVMVARTLARLASVATDPDRADELLAESWTIVESLGDPKRMVEVLNTRGRTAHARGDFTASAGFFERAAEISRSGGTSQEAVVVGNLSDALLHLGEFERARPLVLASLAQARTRGNQLSMTYGLGRLARLRVAEGRYADAARLLGAAETAFTNIATHLRGHDRDAYETAGALARERLGEDAWAREYRGGRTMTLSEAIAFGLGETVVDRSPKPAIDSAAIDVSQPATLPAQGVECAGTGATETPTSGPPSASPVDASRSAPPETEVEPFLRVLALGPLEVFREGTPLTEEAWIYTRPRELLLYLLAHPQGRTRDQIGLAFWPESSQAQVKNSFHVALHRLRRSLDAHDLIVVENDRYRINPKFDIYFDAKIFESEMRAILASNGERKGADVDRLLAATRLYRGDFLEDERVGDWHLATRDNCRRLFIEGLSLLAAMLMERGQFEAAADTLERLVAGDDLREDAYRRLARCLVAIGQRDRALLHLRRLTTLLRDELGAEPEEETLELIGAIGRGDVK